jgi:hypothetical protein
MKVILGMCGWFVGALLGSWLLAGASCVILQLFGLMAEVASTQFSDAVVSGVLSVSYLCAVAIAVWGMASRNKRRVIFTLGWLVIALVGPAMLIGIVGIGLLKLTSSGFVASANLIHAIGWIGMISPFACALTALLFGMTGHLPGTRNPVRKMAV